MEFHCVAGGLAELLAAWDGEALAVGLFEAGLLETDPLRQALLDQLGPALQQRLEQRRFKGKPGDCACFEQLGGSPAVLVLVGLGEPARLDAAALRQAAASAAKAAAGAGARRLALALPVEGLAPDLAARSMAEAVQLALYSDGRFKSEAEPPIGLDRLDLIGLDPLIAGSALTGVAGTIAGVELARQLVAAPANVVTPQYLADTAAAIARDHGLELQLLERADCQALGMGAYLAVTQGSDLPPKFIHLTYRPEGAVQRRVALVGKGLTFDSGGYNLKPGSSAQIELMKFDMGGSAAVLGAARAIGQLRPAGVEVHVIVAACENMINGSAVHPGDIVTAANGKTIEINNTDAEGRLTLADALVYASRLEPDAIVDLATLTGACVIALGEEIAGLWSSSDGLAEALVQAGRAGDEDLWRMPLRASYRQGLKSQLADMKNTGPRAGGSITAALFLQDFVAGDLPWAHLDIAGPVWSEKGRPSDPAGATGFGVRTLVNWILAGAPLGSDA